MLRELLTHWWTQVYSVLKESNSSWLSSLSGSLRWMCGHQHVVAPCLTPRWCCMHEQFPAHGGGKVASQRLACNASTRIYQSRGPPAGPGHEGGFGLSGIFWSTPQAYQTAHQELHSGTGRWKEKNYKTTRIIRLHQLWVIHWCSK